MNESDLFEIRFILDVHLGRLARKLRMLGIDAVCGPETEDLDIIRKGMNEKRIILTRDKGLLRNSHVWKGLRIMSQNPAGQLKEVMKEYDLRALLRPFTRCIECNARVEEVELNDIKNNLTSRTKQFYSRFRKCPVCGRIYWEGSHYERMKKEIESLIKDVY
jgi:uncharacterized protein